MSLSSCGRVSWRRLVVRLRRSSHLPLIRNRQELDMTRNVVLGAAVAAAVSLAGVALADVDDYAFEAVSTELKQGDDVIVAVRLKHKATGNPVPDAVIFARRIDMAPDGMPTMTADLEPLPSTEPGVYRFKTSLAMEGRWQLSLAAKVQGEAGTLQSRLMLKATN